MTTLALHSTSDDASSARDDRRRRARGDLVRVAHGVTVDAQAFRDADVRSQHRARIDGVISRSRPGLVVSHASAVALHGLPWFGPFPDRPTVLDPTRSTGQRLRFVDKVAAFGRELRTVVVDGIEVTDLVSTAVDVALRFDRGHAVAVLDHVLRMGVPRHALLDELDGRDVIRGAARARVAVTFADGAAESVGESIGRLAVHLLGLPAPELQHAFRLRSGQTARVDFWFADQGAIVEFDGMVKYRDRTMRAGRTAEDVVIDEKRREDQLRALDEVQNVGRLIWRDVMPGGDAPLVLRSAGLPVPRRFARTPRWL